MTEVEKVETKVEPKSQGDAEGLEGHSGAEGGHDLAGDRGSEDHGGTERKEKPSEDRGLEG